MAREPGQGPERPSHPSKHPRLAIAAVALIVAAAACAPEREDDLYGIHVENRSELAWANDPELRPRLRALIEASCAHMGLDPLLLYGMTLRIEDGTIPCGSVRNARGCTWRADGVIAVSTLAWISTQGNVRCVEDTPLPHELLHVKIGDAPHADERWDSASWWGPLWSEVAHPDCSGDSPLLIW